MVRATLYLGIACLVGLPGPVASTGIFPALRKRHELALAQNASDAADLAAAAEVLPVPQPMDAGSDGFPVLPAVDQILGGAALTLKTVSKQASNIAGRMASAQKQSEAELARQKSAYENNLKIQEMKNQHVAQENEKISTDIENLKKGNAALRKQAHDIKEKNFVLRQTVHSLESKMGVGREFAHRSMDETDDSKQEVLDVLQRAHPKTSMAQISESSDDDDDTQDDEEDEYDDHDYDYEDDSPSDEDVDTAKVRPVPKPAAKDTATKGTSLLEVSAKVQKGVVKEIPDVSEDTLDPTLDLESLPDIVESTQESMLDRPDAILSTLANDINTLVSQRKQSVANLKSIFVRDFKAGEARLKALISQQKSLDAHRTELSELQTRLKEAVAHLEGTHKRLGEKLHGIGKFLQKLAHVANAPETEMSQLLEKLPKAVNAPSKVAI